MTLAFAPLRGAERWRIKARRFSPVRWGALSVAKHYFAERSPRAYFPEVTSVV